MDDNNDRAYNQMLAAKEIVYHLAELLFAVADGARSLAHPNPNLLAGILEGSGDAVALARDLLEASRH